MRIAFSICCAFISALLLGGCGPAVRSQFSVHEITLPSGEKVYFKRLVKGLSFNTFDQLTISPDPEACREPDARRDYVFRARGQYDVFYRIEGDDLLVFVNSEVV